MKSQFDLLVEDLNVVSRRNAQRRSAMGSIYKSLAKMRQRRTESRNGLDHIDRILGEMEMLGKSMQAAAVKRRATQRREAREQLGTMLNKAFDAFNAGDISGHELRVFEARFNNHMARLPRSAK